MICDWTSEWEGMRWQDSWMNGDEMGDFRVGGLLLGIGEHRLDLMIQWRV